MNWTPLHLHSHYSILDGLSKPNDIASICAKNGYNACALTDHGTISGSVSFIKECKKKNIKPILGCELYVSYLPATIQDKNNKKLSHLVVLAKNYKGWKNLIKLVSRSNDEELFYYKPRIDLDILKEYADDLIAFSGHPGSELANCLFKENRLSQDIRPDAVEVGIKKAEQFRDIFGKDNFFIEIQLIDKDVFKTARIIADILREVSKKTGIPCVATADSHYPERKDAPDQQVLLCSALKTTFKKVRQSLQFGEDVPLGGFFKSTNFHIPTLEEIQAVNTESEIENSNIISEMCEDYDILQRPTLPKFEVPSGQSEHEYLTELCRKGWGHRLGGWGILDNEVKKKEYAERIKTELGVIKDANLAGYFLIVQDYVNWAKKKGWLIGPGRGSAAGSLVSYLVGITNIDPIPHGLLFSRFYNAGRNTADRVEYPDIDVDFPINKRDEVIGYMKDKYGHNQVCQLVTFGTMQGRDALKQVLRTHDACEFNTMNEISKKIPAKAEIEDKMEEEGESSILRWVLKNEPKKVEEYCRIEDDGSLSGEYATYFEQAIRLEGTFRSQGKHAAGVVIGSTDLNTVCPMIHDKNGTDKIAGMEMKDLESIGQVKFDVLGVAALDKLMGINSLLKNGVIED